MAKVLYKINRKQTGEPTKEEFKGLEELGVILTQNS